MTFPFNYSFVDFTLVLNCCFTITVPKLRFSDEVIRDEVIKVETPQRKFYHVL